MPSLTCSVNAVTSTPLALKASAALSEEVLSAGKTTALDATTSWHGCRGEVFDPLDGGVLLLGPGPDGVGQAVEHRRPLAFRSHGGGGDAHLDALVAGVLAGHPRAVGVDGGLAGCEGVGHGWRRRWSPAWACSPWRPAGEPVHAFLELGVVVVVLRAPRVLVRVGPAGGVGEVAPLGLAGGVAAAVEAQAVDGHVVLVEAGLVPALAVLVNGQVGDDLLVACRRLPGSR